MFNEKTAHYCFLALFFVAGFFAIVCFIVAYVVGFSLLASRIMHGLEFVLFLYWITLVFVIKVKWNIQYIGSNTEPVAVTKESFLIYLLSGLCFLCYFYMACTVDRQIIHSTLFQLVSFVSFFWDFRFIRPRIK